jgi:glycine/D-amino acid oxidase-like deaminating enzyme
MADVHFDVVIAGGAAVGSAAAYFLTADASLKCKVLVVERDLGYRRCETTLSAASIRHQFSTPENILMSMFGTAFLRDFDERMQTEGQPATAGFKERGYLFLASPAGLSVLKENHALQTRLGAQIALLDAPALASRYPWLETSDLAAGSLGLAGEGWMDAYGLLQGLHRKAVSQGASYREGLVTGLRRQGRRLTEVRLADGTTIGCGAVVNAAGIGAPALARMAGIDLPVQARKRNVFFVRTPAELPGCPMVIDPSGAYFRPEGQGYITGISPPEAQDPECDDFDVQQAQLEDVLWPLLARRVPGFEALRRVNAWAGHYDFNIFDQNAIIGPHPAIENLYFANGFSGHGLQHSPAVGRALAELILHGEYRTLDLSRLGWQRILAGQPLVEKNIV